LNYVHLRLEVIRLYTLRFEKRHIAFILLILFGLNQSATWYYAAQIHQHRQAERKSKHRNAFFAISYSQFQKAKRMAKDEILIDGKMFDIKSITFEHDAVILYGHFDQKEDRLLAKANHHESKKGDKVKSFKIPFLYVEEIEHQSDFSYLTIESSQHILFSDHLRSVLQGADSPPPKFA
jgi:hypothetical protein